MRRILGLLASVLVVTLGTHHARAAQSSMAMPQGGWHPVVGAGAIYDVQTGNEPGMPWEITVVGQEAGGHWVEMHVQTPEGELISKNLVTLSGIKRMIVKMGEGPPMEMPNLAAMAMAQLPQSGIEQQQPVGRESITTPAGTFMCEHYQINDQDVWINAGVSPYGLVKATGPKLTMTLRKTISGATSRITEAPQAMPGMQQLFGGQGGAPALPPGLFGNDRD